MKYASTFLAITTFSVILGCGSRGGNALENASQEEIDDYQATKNANLEKMKAEMEAGRASQGR